MKKLSKVFDIASKVLLYVAMAVLALVILSIIVNILGRSFFHFSIGGINEIIQYGVMLAMSFGLARTAYNGGHVIVSIILDKFPKKARGIVACVEMLLAAAVFFMTFYVCCNLIPDALANGQTTDVYKIPYIYVYLALAVGLVMSGLVFVFKALESLSTGFSKEEKKD